MITKYSALPFTKKFQLKQASPRPPGSSSNMLCIWKFTQSKYKAPFSIWQWNKRRNKLQKTFNFFFKHYSFWSFALFLMYCIRFFSSSSSSSSSCCSWCWNVVRWEGWERQKHTTEQADVSFHYCIQEWQWGRGREVRGDLEDGGRGRDWRSEPKPKKKDKNKNPKEDMYNHLCGQEAERRPSDGRCCLPVPHTLAAFLILFLRFFLSFISLNIQIIRTILSCQIKKIYRGSLGSFFFSFNSTTKKRYGKYLFERTSNS